MDRRKFLLGIGSASVAGSALLGTGAFTRIESQRRVKIEVAEDPDAYLGLDACPEEPNSSYTEIDDNGHLAIEMSPENPTATGGYGINSDSRTWFHNVFQICNQGKQEVCVWIEDHDDWPRVDDAAFEADDYSAYDGDRRVDFYVEDDDERSFIGFENHVVLDVGDCVCVGLMTNTKGLKEGDQLLDELENEIVIHADADCPEPDEPIDPVITTWTEVGDIDEAGGPVILMGLDSELGAGGSSHGTPEEHADMAQSLLDSVTNDGDGILVVGVSGSSSQSYWTDDVGANVGESVDFVNGASNIETVDFDGYAMLGIGSSTHQISGGMTNDENEALITRAGDIAAFVNEGGALLGKTQDGYGEDAWGYVDPFGNFENEEASFSSVQVTQAGLDLGLTQEGMDGWCCYHEVLTQFPDFFEVLITHDAGGTLQGEAAAIGGEQVIIEREVSLAITGFNLLQVGSTESYDVELENQGTEPIEGEFEFVVSGDGTVTDSLPATVQLDPDESESWTEAIAVECTDTGPLEIDVQLRSVADGTELVEVTMDLECIN